MNERPLGMVWLENRPRLHRLYFRYVPALVAVMVLTVATCAIGVTWLTFQRGEDQRARTADNEALIDCFDDYATALSGSLPAVREASQARNEALKNVLIGDEENLGLGLLISRAQQGIKGDPKKDLASLARTFKAFQVADDHLLKVQAANPYPAAPSRFCVLP